MVQELVLHLLLQKLQLQEEMQLLMRPGVE